MESLLIGVANVGLIAGKLLTEGAIGEPDNEILEECIVQVYQDFEKELESGKTLNQSLYIKKELMKRLGSTNLYELQTVHNPENGEMFAYFFVREDGFRTPFVTEEGTNRVGQIDPQLFQYMTFMLEFNRVKPVQEEMWFEDFVLKVKVEQK